MTLPTGWNYGPEPTEAQQGEVYDAVIVGSGAAGAAAARPLCEAGWRVLMLEQGAFLSPEASYDDVLRAAEPAFGRQANGCWSLVGYPWTTCNVGGGTVFYGGASFRYRPVDFDAARYFPDAQLPVAWPHDYDALEADYTQVERWMGIAADPAQDPGAPPGERDHYLPPVPHSAAAETLREAARRRGLHPFPTPLAVLTQDPGDQEDRSGRRVCDFSGPCIEHACTTGAKGDAWNAFLKPLLAGPPGDRLDLLAGLKGVRLERSREDQVEAVTAVRVDTGKTYRFRARTFILAANAIQSAALLLRSQDRWSPTGLGNERDLVGRGLCFKLNEYVVGYDPDHSGEAPLGPFSTLAILDHYLDDDCPGGMGGLIYEAQYGFRYAPRRDAGAMRLECLLADQPLWHNRVHLTEETDALGLPRLALDYQSHPRDLARLEYMVERCRELLREAGCRFIRTEATDFQLGSCHLHGTCRAHEDPRYGVVNGEGRLHTVDNVYVADGAFMPFPSGLNPTLTIQAHALGLARRLTAAGRPS
jgi:paromamine 6'-oxidase/6'''-hydroxyneomycin C oxidase/2'-deamino-2'-hydroxyparomamine 6'-oxidase